MLPDGAHKRDDDWTVFFLNRSDADAEATNAHRKKRRPTTRLPEPIVATYAQRQRGGRGGEGGEGRETRERRERRRLYNITTYTL